MSTLLHHIECIYSITSNKQLLKYLYIPIHPHALGEDMDVPFINWRF